MTRNLLLLAAAAVVVTLFAMSMLGPEAPTPHGAVSRDPRLPSFDPADTTANEHEAACAHILIAHVESEPPIPGVTRSKDEARALASRVHFDTRDHDFDELAREKSDDPRAERTGGYLGVLPRGRLPLAFEMALFGMEPGQVHSPVETKQGYHVIKRLPVRRRQAQHILITWEGSEIMGGRVERTREQARLLAVEVREECLRDGADFCELAARYSDDPTSRFDCGWLGTIEPGEADRAFEEALYRLRPGNVSEVVESVFGFHVVRYPR